MNHVEWTAPWLGGFLLATGVSHFVVPAYYDRLVPSWLPGRRRWVHLSGIAELIVGAALVSEVGRGLGAWAATGMMVLYVVTHVSAFAQARDDQSRWLDRPSGVVARVTVNVGYAAWAFAVAVSVTR